MTSPLSSISNNNNLLDSCSMTWPTLLEQHDGALQAFATADWAEAKRRFYQCLADLRQVLQDGHGDQQQQQQEPVETWLNLVPMEATTTSLVSDALGQEIMIQQDGVNPAFAGFCMYTHPFRVVLVEPTNISIEDDNDDNHNLISSTDPALEVMTAAVLYNIALTCHCQGLVLHHHGPQDENPLRRHHGRGGPTLFTALRLYQQVLQITGVDHDNVDEDNATFSLLSMATVNNMAHIHAQSNTVQSHNDFHACRDWMQEQVSSYIPSTNGTTTTTRGLEGQERPEDVTTSSSLVSAAWHFFDLNLSLNAWIGAHEATTTTSSSSTTHTTTRSTSPTLSKAWRTP